MPELAAKLLAAAGVQAHPASLSRLLGKAGLNGEYTEKYQPSKFTAIEGRWQTEQPARLILFAWPDPDNERNLFELAVPVIGSFVDDGSFPAKVLGIVTIPKDDRPPIAIPFFGFRIMVGMGLLMLAISWLSVFLWMTGHLDKTRWLLWATFLSFPSGFIAVISGWYTAEVGRQPWAVYGCCGRPMPTRHR